ncbi:hypothetical protein LXL04_008375 [Taraxacum kok-saghyz]
MVWIKFNHPFTRITTLTTRINDSPIPVHPRSTCKASAPVLWAGRVCIFYARLKAGLAGSPSNPLASTTELETDGDDLGFAKWFEEFRGKRGSMEDRYSAVVDLQGDTKQVCYDSKTFSKEIPNRIASAPGKVLITGGYLILERPNAGIVLSTNARFYAIVKPLYDELKPECWLWVSPFSHGRM